MKLGALPGDAPPLLAPAGTTNVCTTTSQPTCLHREEEDDHA
jgi:hypothetical protein